MFQTLQYIALTRFLQQNTENHQKRGKIRNFANFGPNRPKSPQRSKSDPQSVKNDPKRTKFAYFWRVPRGVYVIFGDFEDPGKLTKNAPNSAD